MRISAYEPEIILKRIGRIRTSGTLEWVAAHHGFRQWSQATPECSYILTLSGKGERNA